MWLRGFQGAHGAGYMGAVTTTWGPMGAGVPVLSPNAHLNPSKGRQKGFEIFENLQRPKSKQFRGFWWAKLHGPSGHYVGPHGCLSTRIVTK